MKKSLVLATIISVVFGIFGVLPTALASTPSLSLYASGNSVQVTVNGDANSGVTLYYNQSNYNYGSQSQYLGTTNNYGYFSTSLNSNQHNISSGNMVYVVVNGQQSQNVIWPYFTGLNYGGNIYLSQSSITLSANQSASINISGGNTPYSMYPSPLNIFQAVISGNNLTVTGLNYGSGTLNVCSSGTSNGSSGCAVLNVSVNSDNNNYYNSQITLSQTNIVLNTGNSTTVTISGGGNYYVSANSNSSVASTNISGNILTITGYSIGTSNITVCNSNNYYYNNYNNQCATIYVTVNNYNNYYQTPTAVTFSQSNPTLNIDQSVSLSIYGGDGNNYYISHNSNSSAVAANLNGNTLNLTGRQNSVAVVVICSSSVSCGAVTATVGYNNNYYNNNTGNWVYCASEKQYCGFSGSRNVRYGTNGNYYYRTFYGGTNCSNSVFGDPAYMTVKQCYYQN